VRINVDGATEAYHVVDGRLATLPVGATFNQGSGTLSWQPGPGFAGVHEVVLIKDGKLVPVRVALVSASSKVAQGRGLFDSLFSRVE
jgi:hypothetical protein